jgi:hypothetical protein
MQKPMVLVCTSQAVRVVREGAAEAVMHAAVRKHEPK